jgi:hypothetical protein
VGLERGPLGLVSTIEELLGRKISGSGLEIENMAVGIRRADHATTSIPLSRYFFSSYLSSFLSVSFLLI